MRNFKDRVIVLKSIDYSESDKILTVYGENFGKYSIMAKGVRKIESKNRGHIQTLSVANISCFRGKGMPILVEASSEYIPEYTAKSIKNIERCLMIVNKFLPDEVRSDEIFKGLLSAIKSNFALEKTNRFRLFFLINEGLVSDLNQCDICGKAPSFLNIDNWKVYCNNHIGRDDGTIELNEGVYRSIEFTLALDKYIKLALTNT